MPNESNSNSGSALSGTDPVIRIVSEGSNSSNMLTANTQHSRGGNLTAKYISRRVTLEEGFDASDIRVYMNAYKPRAQIFTYITKFFLAKILKILMTNHTFLWIKKHQKDYFL